MFPSEQVRGIYLSEDLFNMLNYIYDENQSNRIVNQIKIVKHFSISKITAQNKIKQLVDEALIFSKSMGRSNHLYITNKGRLLLKKR